MRIASALLIFLTPWIAARCASPSFRAVEIDNKIEIGYGVTVADVDGDKKPDILLADAKQYVWYQNPSWKKHVMTEKLTQRDHVCIAARDIDGDGKAEVAVGAEWNPGDTVKSGAIFFLQRPKDVTQPWEAIRVQPHEPTTHRMRWVKNWQNEFELVVVPLHGRGNKNGEGEGVKVLAYKMGSSPSDTWTTRTIDDSLHMTHNFDPTQWDDDSAEEPLIASKEGVFVVNWEDGALKRTQLSGTESGGAGEVRLGRLPGGKRFFATVEPMHGTNLVIYTEPKQSGKWDRHVVDSTLVDGHALACADLAGTGADQIVVGWRAMNKPGVKVGIKMFTAADRDGKEWKSTLVDDNTMACEDLCVADLDGNGKLDIIAAGRATKNVKIYFNGAPDTTSGN
jgi:hypothetical protein